MDVVRRILDLTGASPDLVRMVADRPGHDRRYAVDSARIRDLGWSPAHSLDAGGLEETVAWYAEQPRAGGSRSSRATTAATTTSSTPPAFPRTPAGRHACRGNEVVAGIDRYGNVP